MNEAIFVIRAIAVLALINLFALVAVVSVMAFRHIWSVPNETLARDRAKRALRRQFLPRVKP